MKPEAKSKRSRKNQGAVKTRYIVGDLACQKCATVWTVVDLNEHRKAVTCPVCGDYNSINEAIKRAA